MAIHATKDIKIFYSYAQEDKALRKRLDIHLATLRQQGLTSWYDHEILPGRERAEEIERELQAAHIILLLISADFLASFQCYIVEMQHALQRHKAGKARVIPIILRPANWQDTSLKRLQPLPEKAKPVVTWAIEDEAFVDIANGIKRVIDDMAKREPLNDNPDKKTTSTAFANQAQHFDPLSRATTPPITPAKLDFRRKLVTEYDLDSVMAAFKEPLDYGEAFSFVIAGDERVLREYVIVRMVQEFEKEIKGECFTTPPIDLNQQDLSCCPLQSLLEEKIKRRFNYTNARELAIKRPLQHVILTVWNYDLPLLTVQEAISAFWKSFVPTISRHLSRKKLCFVLILAHLPPENQPCLMEDAMSLQLPDFDVQRGLRPWLSRNLHTMNVPDQARDYCLNQLQDLHPNPVQIFRRMEHIASYLQGEYNEDRFREVKVRNKRRSLQR